MCAQLHHVAINVQDFEWNLHLFQKLFHMKIKKTAGEKPNRKVWFYQGIQINECSSLSPDSSNYDHIAISVNNISETVTQALKMNCTPLSNGNNWFLLPEGTKIELIKKTD